MFSSDVDCFVGNHTTVDPEIFQLWIDGCSAQEAATTLQQRGALQSFPGATTDLLLADVHDHFRSYTMLEKLLYNPSRLNEQWTFQMDRPTQQMMITNYYEFDDSVMREILGKKLSSRQRKDLDEVSEKTGVSLKSCRRQFDNAKRVFKAVEEIPGSTMVNIKNQFYLNDELAKKYCAICFIAGNRFETSKRKLQYLTFQDFYTCAHSMMTHWASAILDDNSTADIDREFLMELRELRLLLDREKEHRTMVLQIMKPKVNEKIYVEIEHNFKVYSRTLINIAYGLNHSKELKDLFVDLVEKYIEPCKHLQWTCNDLRVFLDVFGECATQMDGLKGQASLKAVWKRYMDGVTGCLMSMYHN